MDFTPPPKLPFVPKAREIKTRYGYACRNITHNLPHYNQFFTKDDGTPFESVEDVKEYLDNLRPGVLEFEYEIVTEEPYKPRRRF